MPLDELQFAILRTLNRLRSPASAFAGASVLHRHGFRLSDDHDIFHRSGEDVAAIARRDVDALVRAGFVVETRRPLEGLIDAVVGREGMGMTKVQWVEAGSWTFFAPVPDPDFGWRLHMADLAINKALAAGGRRQVRDYVDLVLIHRHIMPLWVAIWAAPGKDPSWSPLSLLGKIAMTNNFQQEEVDEQIVATIDVSAAECGRAVRDALEEARAVFLRLPERTAGRLHVDAAGVPCVDVEAILGASAGIEVIEASRAGTWPSGPDIDHALIVRIVEAFGPEGGGVSR